MTIARPSLQRMLFCALFMFAMAIALPVRAQSGRAAGQRQNREQAGAGVTPLSRIENRMQTRISSRIGGRIDLKGTPQTGQVQQFGDALDRSRALLTTRR